MQVQRPQAPNPSPAQSRADLFLLLCSGQLSGLLKRSGTIWGQFQGDHIRRAPSAIRQASFSPVSGSDRRRALISVVFSIQSMLKMKEEQKWPQNWFYFSRISQSNYISKVLSFVHWNWSGTQNIPWQFVSCFLLMGQKDPFLLLKFFPLKSQILPRSQEIVGLGTQQPQAHWTSRPLYSPAKGPFMIFIFTQYIFPGPTLY